MSTTSIFYLSVALAGYVGTIYCLFKIDTRQEKPGDWIWSLGMAAGIGSMILGILLWAVPNFFKG